MSEKHGSSITLTRRSFVAGAGVVAISCSLGSVGSLIPRAHADEAALDAAVPASADTAAATSQANAQNYFPDASSYRAFNLDTSVAPADFNDDTSSDPLAGFTTLDPQNLYVGYMNRTGYDKGSAYVADSLEALTASSMKLDSMARKTLGSTSLDTNWKEYQYHANNACTLEHSGEQLIVSNTIYTGTYKSRHGKDRESGQDIQLQRFSNGRVQTLARAHEDLTVKDNPLIMEHIQQEGSLGLLAMVGGDFDGDGNQELAIYTPWSYNPFIIVYRFDSSKGELVEEQRLYLGDINTSFSISSSDWRMPIVHLATFSHGSYDDLVVTLSLPLTYQNGYGSHSPFSYMAIYSRKTKETRPRLERIYHYIPDFGSYRMRFASTLQTDLNGNGVPELIMAGHYNAYSKGDQVGWMVPEKNLVQMFTFDTVKEIYQYVWDVPQEVPALSDIFVQYEMCAPAALATGKFLRSEANDLLFLEGYVFSLSSTNKKGDSEAAHFRDSSFTSLYHMDLTGYRNHFITKAVSGNFAKTNIGTEQLIVQSGAVESSNYKVTFDVRWVLEQNGKLATEDTDPSFIHNASTDDNGTFLTIAACDINKNNAFKFALKSKSFGWSAPQPLAILASVPYWSELSDERLGEEKTDIGTTTFGISSSESAGTEGRWGLGGGFNMSAELLLGAGILGNSAMLGGGFDFEAMLNYVGSYYHERNVERVLTYEEYAGRTMVVTSAVPVVVYEYDVYVPEFTVTQDYLDEYNKHAAPGTQWGPEKVGTKAGNVHVAYKVDNTYDSTLGLMTLEDYNNAAANVGSPDVPPIDMAAVFPHTQGDPTTYPTQTSQIANVHNNGNALLAGPNVQVAADKGSTASAEITVTDTSQFTNGFDITVGGGMSLAVQAQETIGIALSVSGHAGWKAEATGGASWVSSQTKGAQFSTSLPSLHPLSYLTHGGNEYSYATRLAVWQTDAVAKNPLVIGYVVEGTGSGAAPKSLPLYPMAYSANEHSIIWAWSNNTTRPAGAYGVALPTSTNEWTVPAGNVMGVDTGRFWIEDGLAAGDTRQVRFQSYDDLGQSNPSAYSPAIVGTTIGGDVPAIDEQPKSVTVFGGTPATFSVQAHSQRGEALSYQWFYLDTSNNAYAEWKPVVGETGPDYAIDAADTLWNRTLFCVDVMDRTVNASGVVPTVRSQPARLGVELTSAIADPDAAAATLRMVPTVTLELTPTDDNTIVQHRDEFFVPYGCTFDMTFTVKDAAGDPCLGKITLSRYTYENGRRNVGTSKDLALTDGLHTLQGDYPASDQSSSYWPLTPSGGDGARVFEVEARLSLDSPTVNKVLPINEYFIINYGVVLPERAAHLLTCDTEGLLPGGPTYALTKHMPLPSIAPAMVGAQFDGWFTDADLANPFEPPFASGPGQTTVYSAWSQNEYAVSYELDGGTNSPDNPATLMNDSTTVTLRDPSKEGYAFEGWFADSSLSQPVTVIPRGATGDISLYAKWRLIEYPLFYFAGIGKNPAGNPTSHTVLDGELPIAPPMFEGVKAGTNAWYADSLFTQKAPGSIPAGSIGDEAFYGYADFAQPEPEPEPGPAPTPEPTPSSTDPAQPKPLVRTGDKQGPLHLIAVAVVTAGAALAASLGFRGKEDDR
ncbi:hypothetical protein GKG38_04745 [Gordonibacter urolithinfaciens]|uniref:Repeat protein n=1 Tax=Gordonibacter urolithinfaciens TaxID=1335613 RepID=A0A7K0IA20_9ACTN|nr:InlB B-repeat-containing protein [Gordonibacter urolithinfaciens]MSA94378.1 hypothetical protein [Gordonibacter urolithinfaciens]